MCVSDAEVIPADFKVVQIQIFTRESYDTWHQKQSEAIQRWILSSGFSPDTGRLLAIPSFQDQEYGEIFYYVGIRGHSDLEALAALYEILPAGIYQIEGLSDDQRVPAAIGWVLQAYQFNRYKKSEIKNKKLVLNAAELSAVLNYTRAHYLIRDLINTPADHMGPSELSAWAEKISGQQNFNLIRGDELLAQNFPAIHAVGRASDDAPCLSYFEWGNPTHPKVALVGKGVCFDTGGLDLKDAEGMRWMKKDMGGAAHALGLAKLIMAEKLPIHLSVYIPTVENAVSGNAYRPGDVISTRKGLSVEIGNTDAEGRVILSDALWFASESKFKPELIIDFATLTGAARVALGAELPALFSNQDDFANLILEMGLKYEDPLWRMPLHQPYKAHLKSSIADLNNMSKVSYGGAITAALFLESFIGDDITWCHIDLMAFNTSSKPAKPEGGEAMGLRAVFQALKTKYGES